MNNKIRWVMSFQSLAETALIQNINKQVYRVLHMCTRVCVKYTLCMQVYVNWCGYECVNDDQMIQRVRTITRVIVMCDSSPLI